MFKFVKRDNIAFITLNRPNAANGLSNGMVRELCKIAERCDNDAEIKVVVLSGEGKYFSVGGDIKEMATFGDDTSAKIKELADYLHKVISLFARMDALVIVAVNGIAAGAGFSLSIASDFVIAAESASFTMGYTHVGLSPDGGSSYYLPRLVGLKRAQELLFFNRTLSAQEALEWGLINKVVSGTSLMEVTEQLAITLASGSSTSNAIVKKLLLCTYSNSLETQMEIEGRYIAKCADSRDGKEGISAFIEKRIPSFT